MLRIEDTALVGQQLTSLVESEDGPYPPLPDGVLRRNRYPFKTLASSTSADGQWTAAVIANYYGPIDVIVVSNEPYSELSASN